jgi:hypothetical protein
MKGSGPGLISSTLLFRHVSGGTYENHSRGERSVGRDSNSGPRKYETQVLTTWP